MPKGLALTIGLNSVSSAHYDGWSGELTACEADAQDMAEVARSKKFSVKSLLTKAATRENVMNQLAKAASTLKAEDIFMLSYSGHGGQLPDTNKDEDDNQDETWCLYDGQLIDDEIYCLLGRFAAGTRILVFSDSCHSGTVTKAAFYQGTVATRSAGVGSQEARYRAMPPEAARRTYQKNKDFYDKLQKNPQLVKAEDSVKGIRAPHFGLPGQPAVFRRNLQRPFHRNPPAGLDRRPIQQLPEILRGDHQSECRRISPRTITGSEDPTRSLKSKSPLPSETACLGYSPQACIGPRRGPASVHRWASRARGHRPRPEGQGNDDGPRRQMDLYGLHGR